MALNVATFRTRTLSALAFLVVMLAGLLWNQWSFFALFTLIHIGCWKEFLSLMGKIDPRFQTVPRPWAIGFPLMGWGGMWWALRSLNDTLIFAGIVGTALIAIGFVLVCVGACLRPWSDSSRNIWYALAGVCYISLPWSLMLLLHGIGDGLLSMARMFQDPSPYQRIALPAALPCILIFSIWINDTMAYIVGSFIGKTPFSPISPKKTWEGTAGGAILCVGAMTLLGHYVGIFGLDVWIAFSAIAAVAGTLGDLLESKLKRMAGVKDSGHILPGHGGFLDRFDSLLVATPVAFVYIMISGI